MMWRRLWKWLSIGRSPLACDRRQLFLLLNAS
jgi:hypothetical protein